MPYALSINDFIPGRVLMNNRRKERAVRNGSGMSPGGPVNGSWAKTHKHALIEITDKTLEGRGRISPGHYVGAASGHSAR
ncbi:hypothetical protein CEXT_293681 [Caerostris extrusa]|uniref:Uncharacterized protein n=1 Tax=Caerostris extrusa TaxID=172846 RepID=A0AAV4UVL0_CAEEX|nr:hypothetical protein CEXT_293681 [Caerostris extrusa]